MYIIYMHTLYIICMCIFFKKNEKHYLKFQNKEEELTKVYVMSYKNMLVRHIPISQHLFSY